MSEITSESKSVLKSPLRLTILIGCVIVLITALLLLWWRNAHPSFDRYSAALQAMRMHHITVDGGGRVDFSKDFPGLTPRDFALITWFDDGSFRAVFPTYHGEGAELAGLMYTSRPLQEEDTQLRVSGIHFDQRVIKVGSYDSLLLEQRLNDHWYKVSYRLH